MGCKTSSGFFNPQCSGLTISDSHCGKYNPGAGNGVTFTYTEYPQNPIRTGNYNIPGRDNNFVMYDSIVENAGRFGGTIPVSAGNCGKINKVDPCNSQGKLIFDYFPSELSFDYNFSDTFFAYLYDVSNEAGVVGIPCYYIEDRSQSRTGGTGGGGEPLDDSYESDSVCHPCSAFTCTAASTSLSYTCDTDYTGDPDCPHPTLFGFGTTSYKVAFSYDALSTQLPNGVVDLEMSYDGVTYTDVWNEDDLEGVTYITSQNTWQTGEESVDDFIVFELDGNLPKEGFRVKVRIRPNYDDSGASTVFNGTEWEITEILSPGTGYAVNDTFNLTYEHVHPDTTSTTFTVTLRIKTVGPVNAVSESPGFDVLRTGDTINGHSITRVLHMDEQHFPYHVAYLDGSGSNFAKDTQYTSNRAHVITTVAGFGIPDRAILFGKYEFSDKSMQFVTADVSKTAPNTYDSVKQPEATVSVTNGRVSGVTITDGGAGWDEIKETPNVVITAPTITSGKQAKVEATFSGGVMTAVEITDAGAGYDSDNPPQLFIINNYEALRETRDTGAIDPTFDQRNAELGRSIPKPSRNTVDPTELSAFSPDTYKKLVELGIESDTITKIISEFNETVGSEVFKDYPEVTQADIDGLSDSYNAAPASVTIDNSKPTVEIKLDPDRRRVQPLPQRRYSRESAEKLRESIQARYDLSFMDNSVLENETKELMLNEFIRTQKERNDSIENIIQDVIPEYTNYKESFVETTQGPFSELPEASTYTKYLMTQYRADPAKKTSISVTLSMTPVNEGCAHFTCNAPATTPGGTTNNADGSTTTTSYTMSSLLGPGCKAWTINGDMTIFHDLSRAAQDAAAAGEAYGNPYTIT